MRRIAHSPRPLGSERRNQLTTREREIYLYFFHPRYLPNIVHEFMRFLYKFRTNPNVEGVESVEGLERVFTAKSKMKTHSYVLTFLSKLSPNSLHSLHSLHTKLLYTITPPTNHDEPRPNNYYEPYPCSDEVVRASPIPQKPKDIKNI